MCPHLQDVCTCLVWKVPCICWPSLLACAASFFMVFFVGPGVLPCVFYNFAWFLLHFCIVFPDWMVWRGVCAIVYVDLHSWLALLHFSCFFRGSWSLPVRFLQFCMVLPSFLHSLPRLNGLERGVCHLSVPPFARCMHLSCGKLHVYVDLHFWLALLHFSWFFSWVLESSRVFSTILHGSALIFA